MGFSRGRLARAAAIDDTSGVRGLLPLVVLASIGCGPMYGAGTITRRLDGEPRTGIFVSPFSYEHFVRGELAYVAGDLRQAREEYLLARAGPEDDPLLIARLADVLDRLGREEEALAVLREGDALDAESELISLTRGRIHERRGRIEEAKEAYSRALSLAPRSEDGPLALAALLRAHGEPAEADAVLERYLERAGGAGAARARLALAVEHGQAQAAADAVRALLEIAPARAGEVRSAVRAALDAGQPELAQRLLAALPEADADRPLRLRAALDAGDRARAEGLLASWMPDTTSELVTVARGYLAVGMPDRAIELAQVALRTDGGPTAQLVLGRALRARGRLGEAVEVLATIGPGTGAWPEAPLELAETLRSAGLPALAAEALARAHAERPTIELAIALAAAREEAGDPAGALAALEGDDARVRVARARLLERLGRVDEAATLYATLGDDPAIGEGARLRAEVEAAWRDGERERAIARLSEWVEAAPEDLLARARLAELLAELGRAPEAREVASGALPLAIDATLRRRLTALVAAGLAAHAGSS